MSWLKNIYGREKANKTINISVFVLEDNVSAAEYAKLLTDIENSNSLSLVEEKENWDQMGICTVIVKYSSEG